MCIWVADRHPTSHSPEKFFDINKLPPYTVLMYSFNAMHKVSREQLSLTRCNGKNVKAENGVCPVSLVFGNVYPSGYTSPMSTTTVTISPWGNSHGIRLTRELMQSLGVSADTQLQARVVGKGQLELRAVPQRKSLAEKLRAYDPALHGGEISDGVAVGAEFEAKA